MIMAWTSISFSAIKRCEFQASTKNNESSKLVSIIELEPKDSAVLEKIKNQYTPQGIYATKCLFHRSTKPENFLAIVANAAFLAEQLLKGIGIKSRAYPVSFLISSQLNPRYQYCL